MNKRFEQSLVLYLKKLVEKAKEDLDNNYNYKIILNNDFDTINAYLINKALNINECNLIIQTVLSESKRSFYYPVIIAVAASLLFKNYCYDNKLPFCALSSLVQPSQSLETQSDA